MADHVLDTFYKLFIGNTSAFVIHAPPFTEKANGKVSAAWCGYAKYGSKSFPSVPDGAEKDDFVPLEKEHYREHLNGDRMLAIAPVMDAHVGTKIARNVCYLAAIDIDVDGADYMHLTRRMHSLGFKFAPFLSKSAGLHMFFFFTAAEPADKVIVAMQRVVEVLGLDKLYPNKVEVFPKQATFTAGEKNANCLSLPYFNAANVPVGKMLSDEGKLLGIRKALTFVAGQFTSLVELNQHLANLPYADAPYCVQAVALSGALGEDSGRNDFLFTAAVYLKKKLGEDFADALREVNNAFLVPLPEKDVAAVYASVSKKAFDGYKCSGSACAAFCDKALCRQREFGVGRKKDAATTGADCWGPIIRYRGAESYYEWSVKKDAESEFVSFRVNAAEDLQDQRKIQTICLDKVNWVPTRVKDEYWVRTINECLQGVEAREVEVTEGSDASFMASLADAFMEFLARPGAVAAPLLMRTGSVFVSNEKISFSVVALRAYLGTAGLNMKGVNIRDFLVTHGCFEDVIVWRKRRDSAPVTIKCMSRLLDDKLVQRMMETRDIQEIAEDMFEQEAGSGEEAGDAGEEPKF